MTKPKTKTKRKLSPTVTRAYVTRKFKAMAKKHAQQLADLQSVSDKRVVESFRQGHAEGGNDEPPPGWGSHGYRSSTTTFRDESSTSQEAAAERMYRLWATNFVAKPMIEIKAEYIWGDGPIIQGDTTEIQKVLDDHWNDDVNDWPEKGLVKVRDLSMYGELITEAFVNKYTGRVRWGGIDVIEVEDIITNAENREQIIAIRTKHITLDDGGTTIPPRLLKIITIDPDTERLAGVKESDLSAARAYEAGDLTWRGRPRENFKVLEKNRKTDEFKSGWTNVKVQETCYGRAWRVSEGHDGKIYNDRTGEEVNGVPYDGQCFFFRVNTTSLGMRGRPDLLALIDWLDRLDQLFYDFLEHAALLNDFVWDLEVETTGEKTLKEFRDEFVAAQSQSGKVFARTPNVKLTPLNPDLKAADWDAMIQPLLERLAGGARLPVHFIGSGGDANLATATAMGGPTFKGFVTRQGIVKRMLTKMLTYVIDCAVAAGQLDEKVVVKDEKDKADEANTDAFTIALDELEKTSETEEEIEVVPAREAFSVEMPAVSERDMAAAATVFVSVANAVTTLAQQGLMDKKIAVTFLSKVAEMLDVDIDINEWLAALENLEPRSFGDEDALAGVLEGDGDDNADALLDAMGASEVPTLTPSMVQGALKIVTQVGEDQLERESGLNALELLFRIPRQRAELLLGLPTVDVATNGSAGDFKSALTAIVNEGAREEPKGE